MPTLPHDPYIYRLHEAAIACGFTEDGAHQSLLLGLPQSYVSGLPAGGAPSVRLMTVLGALNNTGALRDGTVPLAQWLKNAIRAAGERAEQAVFVDALRRIDPAAAAALGAGAPPPGPDRASPVLRLLFLAAQPEDRVALNAGGAHHQIQQAISDAGAKGKLTLLYGGAVRPTDLPLRLNEHHPHILHFHSHGDAKGRLVLEWNGQAMPVRPEAITALLKTMKGEIRLVFFATCYSDLLAEAAAAVTGLSIGMRDEIKEEAVIQLASGFYRGVAQGLSVQDAFDQALAVLAMLGLGEQDKPKLCHGPGVDPAAIVLLRQPLI